MFNPSAPGNKGLIPPREGYEQRKFVHKNSTRAIDAGWIKRPEYIDKDYGLFERRLHNFAESDAEKPIKKAVKKSTA